MALYMVHLNELVVASVDGTLEGSVLLSQVLDQVLSEDARRGELFALGSADLTLDRAVAVVSKSSR